METDERLKSDAIFNELRYDELQKDTDEFILESSAAIVVEDVSGKIIRVTREVEDALGYLKNELLGESLEILIPDLLKKKHAEHRTRQSGITETRQMAHGRMVTARMKDGRERTVTISLKSMFFINKTTGAKVRWTRANLIFAPVG